MMVEHELCDEPVLTTVELNRALLDRQMLLERQASTLPDALEQVAGVQAQYRAAYIGLWARLKGFEREHLTTGLHDGSVIQATLMRQTIHVVSRSDFVHMSAGVRRARREWWLRVSKSRSLEEADYQNLADKLAVFLADGPKSRQQLLAETASAGYPRHALEGVTLWVDLVRVPPQGTWEHPQADLYGLADDWLDDGRPMVDNVDVSDGLDLLVQRYFRAFGPGSLGDVASWAGVPAGALEPSVDRLDLRRYRSEQGGLLLDLRYGPIPGPDVVAPVRLLPSWDATLLVHAKRAAIVSDEHRSSLLNMTSPIGCGAILVDGKVAGTWRFVADRIETETFVPLSAPAVEAIAAETEALSAFYR